MQMSRWRVNRVYRDKFEAPKARNKQQKICENVTQFALMPEILTGGVFSTLTLRTELKHSSHTCVRPEQEGSPQHKPTPPMVQLDWLTLYVMGNKKSKS